MVNKVLPYDEVLAYSKQIALELIPPQGAWLAVRETKKALHKPLISALKRALDNENQGMKEAFSSFDYLEAISARFERREPTFQGK